MNPREYTSEEYDRIELYDDLASFSEAVKALKGAKTAVKRTQGSVSMKIYYGALYAVESALATMEALEESARQAAEEAGDDPREAQE